MSFNTTDTMGYSNYLDEPDINLGLMSCLSTSGAVLLDVRSPEEFKSGSIPGSKNVPLQSIDKISSVVEDKATPLFVYCHSGKRSKKAVSALEQMGYTNINNIGGIASYHGELSR